MMHLMLKTRKTRTNQTQNQQREIAKIRAKINEIEINYIKNQ
jgi:hypothetical protein